MSPELARAFQDPMDLPTAKGPEGRKCKVPAAKKVKIATIAARGRIFRNDRAVCEGLHELRGDIGDDVMVSSNGGKAGQAISAQCTVCHDVVVDSAGVRSGLGRNQVIKA